MVATELSADNIGWNMVQSADKASTQIALNKLIVTAVNMEKQATNVPTASESRPEPANRSPRKQPRIY